MTKKEIFKKAHEMTKKNIRKGDNYKTLFSICLKLIHQDIKKQYTIVKRLINHDGFVNERKINIVGTIEECQNYLIYKLDKLKNSYPDIKIHLGTNCIYAEKETLHGNRKLSYTIQRLI